MDDDRDDDEEPDETLDNNPPGFTGYRWEDFPLVAERFAGGEALTLKRLYEGPARPWELARITLKYATTLCTLRRKLEPYGFSIEHYDYKPRSGEGWYRLVPRPPNDYLVSCRVQVGDTEYYTTVQVVAMNANAAANRARQMLLKIKTTTVMYVGPHRRPEKPVE